MNFLLLNLFILFLACSKTYDIKVNSPVGATSVRKMKEELGESRIRVAHGIAQWVSEWRGLYSAALTTEYCTDRRVSSDSSARSGRSRNYCVRSLHCTRALTVSRLSAAAEETRDQLLPLLMTTVWTLSKRRSFSSRNDERDVFAFINSFGLSISHDSPF